MARLGARKRRATKPTASDKEAVADLARTLESLVARSQASADRLAALLEKSSNTELQLVEAGLRGLPAKAANPPAISRTEQPETAGRKSVVEGKQ